MNILVDSEFMVCSNHALNLLGRDAMKWMLLAAAAVVAAGLWLPGQAAQPAPQAGADDPISFEEYRDWRLRFIERRQAQLAAQLSAADLPARQRARLEQTKAYYDWLAGLPATDRDRRFRERFDQIDANHDGVIDRDERAAWRDKQRALYRRTAGPRQPPEEHEPH
jgi:hypothetical protein